MEKNIWIIHSNRQELIEAQQLINANGGMRAFCILSETALDKAMVRNDFPGEAANRPSLILMDYITCVIDNTSILNKIQQNTAYAGVPLIFMVEERNHEIDEKCYELGATIVATKPFSRSAILRIERTAWQYEQSRNFEKILHKQANELVTAKEIRKLNAQLETRNMLLRQIFGRYFSDEVVDVILDDPSGASIGGNKKELVVMMLDMRGFTSISELLSADEVTDMINNFLGEMTEIIFAYKGSIIEFIGDAILAVFGAPVASESPEEDAIIAAIHMQNAMEKVNKYNSAKKYPMVEMGIGIHRGEVFIGNIGSEKLMRYNVIGKAVNLCSRIENYSVGGQILISDDMVSSMKAVLFQSGIFEISTKGVEHPVRIHEIRGIKGRAEAYLENNSLEEMRVPTEKITLTLNKIVDKSILDSSYIARVRGMTHKRVNIELADKYDISTFDDFEITARDDHNNTIFSGLYGKVIDLKNQNATIHFTYLKDDYIELYDKFFS